MSICCCRKDKEVSRWKESCGAGIAVWGTERSLGGRRGVHLCSPVLWTPNPNPNPHYTADPDRTDNLTKNERDALQELLDNKHIIIKLADKGSKIVMMDKQQYAFEAHWQLNNIRYYRKINSTIHTKKKSMILFYSYISINSSPQNNEISYVTRTNHTPNYSTFYRKSIKKGKCGRFLGGYRPADQSSWIVIAPHKILPNIVIISWAHSPHCTRVS